jgi:hypothetical protein
MDLWIGMPDEFLADIRWNAGIRRPADERVPESVKGLTIRRTALSRPRYNTSGDASGLEDSANLSGETSIPADAFSG